MRERVRAQPSELEMWIDRTKCDGHRLCAELFPERIRLDDWGYPIITPGSIPGALMPHAQRAVDGCPVLALALRRMERKQPVRPILDAALARKPAAP